ncbi:MAG: hypothetical protein E6J21_13235 [Chloroflexota bacterium]|nr:MAG: hypothetical protein E6J21_13235 [Chloroflexota bacterium]
MKRSHPFVFLLNTSRTVDGIIIKSHFPPCWFKDTILCQNSWRQGMPRNSLRVVCQTRQGSSLLRQ